MFALDPQRQKCNAVLCHQAETNAIKIFTLRSLDVTFFLRTVKKHLPALNVYKYYLTKCSCNKKKSEILQNLLKECRFPGESKMAAAVVNGPLLSDTVLGHHILPHFLFFPSFPGSVSCITCLLSQRICCVTDLDQYEWNSQAQLKVLHDATEKQQQYGEILLSSSEVWCFATNKCLHVLRWSDMNYS